MLVTSAGASQILVWAKVKVDEFNTILNKETITEYLILSAIFLA